MEQNGIEEEPHEHDEKVGLQDRVLQQAGQVQHASSQLPDVKAKPDQVRSFLSHLLQKRGVPEEHIQEVVRHWTIGSGQEMRSYDPAMYLDIFGLEDGWIIYREVSLRIHEEACENFMYKYEFEIGVVIILTFTAGMFYIARCDVDGVALFIGVFGGILGGVFLIMWLTAGLLLTGSPEAKIEKMLRDCRKSISTKRN